MAVLNNQSPEESPGERKDGLRQWFGPSRKEVWRLLAQGIGGTYVDGGFWRGDKVAVQAGEWTVTLDTHIVSAGKSSTTYTRMRAPYVNADGFRFTIYRRSIFSGLGKAMGMQDIEIGDPSFDEAFIVKANDQAKVRRLLGNGRIRQLLTAQPDVLFEVKDDEGWFATHFPEGVDELCFLSLGVLKDLDLLEAMYALFAETLEELCRIGSAYEDDPQVKL